MKKQMAVALVPLLLIPIVVMLGGLLFSLINPEIAAGHPNYVRNYRLLSAAKLMMLFGSAAIAAILWLLPCFLVVRSKQRSSPWLFLAALGPIGFAILARLQDRASGEQDRYSRFVGHLNRLVRVVYEACCFGVIGLLAYQTMVLKRNLMILYQSATTGMSTAQIIAQQNASSGMWAFSEGIEVMYLVVLFYVLWPVVFNVAGHLATMMASPKAR
jgi:hypothetical protein